MSDVSILSMQKISKAFPGVQALDEVSLDLMKGEVLVLVGENGAGKSTLMKILSGALRADSGQIFLDGSQVDFASPKEAMAHGIRIINQELSYIKDMSVAENIFLGNWPMTRSGRIDYRKLKEQTRQALDKVKLEVNPFVEVCTLSTAEKQLVEIAKALSDDFKVLVMDEPTAALNDAEISNLFTLIRDIVAQGKSIIYITHKMAEVFAIANRVQVMRDGRSISVKHIRETASEIIVREMVGREIKDMYPKNDIAKGDILLEASGLCNDVISDVSISVRSGEILGLFGLMGAGRTNIVEAIFGVRKLSSGCIRIKGDEVKINSPKQAMKLGIAYLPNERKTDGLILEHSVNENIVLANINNSVGTVKLNLKQEARIAENWIGKLRIKTPSGKVPVQKLSGGNQQKVVIAKALETKPSILILNEPTRGIDVGAKVEIYKLMEDLCEQGMAIIMISSELPEIMAISDRISVVHEGRVTGELDKNDICCENLMKLAIGGI